jgi:hypothetical protein
MDAGKLGLLDNLRLSNGPEGLKNYFRELLRVDRNSALAAINDSDTRFGTLYLLKSELPEKIVQSDLNPLYRKAVDLADSLTGKVSPGKESNMRKADGETSSVLRWIIRTGLPEEGLGSKYEQLMERSAALLVKSFGDASILPELADMIFERNRRGALLHELVWAFFEARCPESLRLFAQRLESADRRDVELAKNLLCFIPCIADEASATTAEETTHNFLRSESGDSAGAGLYLAVMNWLSENKHFLRYTGESLHLCSMPRHYRVSWPAKYLCRPVSLDSGEPMLEYTAAETGTLSRFEKLPEILQEQLAEYSYALNKRDIRQWSAWIRLPLEEQAAAASIDAEGWL